MWRKKEKISRMIFRKEYWCIIWKLDEWWNWEKMIFFFFFCHSNSIYLMIKPYKCKIFEFISFHHYYHRTTKHSNLFTPPWSHTYNNRETLTKNFSSLKKWKKLIQFFIFFSVEIHNNNNKTHKFFLSLFFSIVIRNRCWLLTLTDRPEKKNKTKFHQKSVTPNK